MWLLWMIQPWHSSYDISHVFIIALQVQYLGVCSYEGDDSEEVEDALYLQHSVQEETGLGWTYNADISPDISLVSEVLRQGGHPATTDHHSARHYPQPR